MSALAPLVRNLEYLAHGDLRVMQRLKTIWLRSSAVEVAMA